ncbi:DUF429 domain-containing protein [Streptomyces sp. NPDC058691]|uniref:DUF429 domain-containing protein n=1 Tax=Streptomyces sp. NPDC058691 TaxID=3346601 RepID=UPI00365688D4
MEQHVTGAGRGGMVTVGVDLAGYSAVTGVCRVTWAAEPVVELLAAKNDDHVLDAMRSADKTGLDAPVGWPVGFAALLTAHQTGEALPVASRYATLEDGRLGLSRFTHRYTDDAMWKRTGAGRQRPLSVSADRLGVVAMRAVSLLERLGDGAAIARDGSGPVAEVYPAYALLQWGIAPALSYKGPKPAAMTARAEIIDSLEQGLQFALHQLVRDRCIRSDHDLDALISALVSRAVACGLTYTPETDDEHAMAAIEGWAHVPRRDAPLVALRETDAR